MHDRHNFERFTIGCIGRRITLSLSGHITMMSETFFFKMGDAITAFYTPGIYADGYIVFAFPFVHSYTYVSSFVIPESVRGIYVKVFVKVSLVVYIS